MRVSDNDHLLEEIVGAPPGLSSRSVFLKSGPKSGPKVKQKAEWKGKVVKGKGKHKLKGKDGKSNGKWKGSKGRTKTIDKKGAGSERRLQLQKQIEIQREEGCIEGI